MIMETTVQNAIQNNNHHNIEFQDAY